MTVCMPSVMRSMNSVALAASAAARISLRRRVAPRIGDVLSDRAVEQKHILLDNAQQRTKRFNVVIAQIAAIERHAPGRRIIKSGNQIAERRFARAAGADQSHGLARGYREVDVAQRRLVAAGIGERDVLKRDLPGDRSPIGLRANRAWTASRATLPTDRGSDRVRSRLF